MSDTYCQKRIHAWDYEDEECVYCVLDYRTAERDKYRKALEEIAKDSSGMRCCLIATKALEGGQP